MSGPEIFVIIIVALLLFGAEKLPDIAKTVGRGMRDFRKATDDIRREIETSTVDFRKDLNDVSESIRHDVTSYTDKITSDVNEVSQSIKNDMNDVTSEARQGMNDLSASVNNDANEIKENIAKAGEGPNMEPKTSIAGEQPEKAKEDIDISTDFYKEVKE